ncbi:Rv1733c family protein [Mycolicibacterium stellerae]|uniref:Rv1733c family protein n=1 Tax=Mycolicibacterium stellerae TaxID=2358193 RepID=UPI000F0B1F37|nr:hypothetical protein [Mycolicibacterium stellerae]
MQTFTFGLGSWPRRLAARSPLVRGSDRIEAVAALLVVVIALLAAPVAAAAGTVIHDNLSHRSATERVSRHEVAATVTEDSTLIPEPFATPFFATVRWEFGGTMHTGELRTSGRVKAGETTSVWVDSDGRRASAPMTDSAAALDSIACAFGLWFSAVGVAAAAWIVLRIRLNRWRHAGWDRELRDLADNDGRTNRNA